MLRYLVLLAIQLHVGSFAAQTTGDGCGNYWPKYCHECGRKVQVVRPGKAQCPYGHDLWTG